MRNIRTFIILLITLLISSCEVQFDDDLRTYIDNIADRNPLNFTLSGTGATTIDGDRAINMGHSLFGDSMVCTVTSNEVVDISLIAFEEVTGDFSIAALDPLILGPNESFSFTVTYNETTEGVGNRVSQEIYFEDSGGRKYYITLWASNREGALSYYNEDGESIDVIDLGNWEFPPENTVVVKNEGLAELDVTVISNPSSSDITISDTSLFTLDINEERELGLTYGYNGNVIDTTDIDGSGLILFYSYDGNDYDELLDIIAGGSLPVEATDSDGNPMGFSVDFGTNSSTVDTRQMTLTNTSDYTLNIRATTESATGTGFTFVVDSSIVIEAGESYTLQVTFYPYGAITGYKSRSIELLDIDTGRTQTLSFSGDYSI